MFLVVIYIASGKGKHSHRNHTDITLFRAFNLPVSKAFVITTLVLYILVISIGAGSEASPADRGDRRHPECGDASRARLRRLGSKQRRTARKGTCLVVGQRNTSDRWVHVRLSSWSSIQKCGTRGAWDTWPALSVGVRSSLSKSKRRRSYRRKPHPAPKLSYSLGFYKETSHLETSSANFRHVVIKR